MLEMIPIRRKTMVLLIEFMDSTFLKAQIKYVVTVYLARNAHLYTCS